MPIEILRDAVIPQNGYVVRRLALHTIASNVISTLLVGNKRTVEVCSLADEASVHHVKVDEMLTAGRGRPKHWTALDGKDLNHDFDMKKIISEMSDVLRRMFWATSMPPKRVRNYSQALNHDISQGHFGEWDVKYGSTPATGYPVEIYSWTTLSSLTSLSPLELPSEAHPASIAFAKLCFELDRGLLGKIALPELDKYDGNSSKVELPGRFRMLSDKASFLGAIPAQLSLQLPVLWAHIHEPYWRQCAMFVERMAPHSKARHDEWFADLDRVKAIALHPLAQSLLSAYRAGECDTQYGDLPMLSIATSRGVDQSTHEFTEVVVAQTVTSGQYGRWGDLEVVADNDNLVSGPSGKQPRGLTTVPALASRLGTLDNLAKHMPAVATIFGWGSRGTDLSCIRDATVTPRFSLCDGKRYSVPSGEVLAGIVPNLSLGLHRGTGFENEAYDPEFNVDLEQYSVAVVDGFASPMTKESILARHTVAGSMWMGESDADRVDPKNLEVDPTGKLVMEYFESKSSQYVRDYYGRPTAGRDEQGNPLPRPVWDATVVGTDPKSVQKDMLSVYPKRDVLATSECPLYTYVGTTTSGRFFYRLLVQSSQLPTALAPSGYTFVDSDGVARYGLNRAHRVLFRGKEVEVSHGTDAFEKAVTLVAMATPASAGVIPADKEQSEA